MVRGARFKDMRSRILLPLLALAAVLIASVGVVASAGAADTHAPKGARLDWLPSDEWVMSGWLPFDEDRLDVVVAPTTTSSSSGSTTTARCSRSRTPTA